MRTRIVRCAALTASAICTATVMTSCALFERRMEHKVKTEVSFSWWGKDARNEYTLDGLKAYQNSNKDVVVRPEYADFDGFKTRMDVEFFSDTTADIMQLNYSWLAEAYEKVMQPLCKKLDMPKTALDVLIFLANNPEFNTAGDVCRYRNIKAALVSFHVEKLVEAGFVERQAVKGDRRKCRLVCTEKAQPVIKEGRELQKKFAQKLIAGFSDDDMAHFRKCLHIVSDNIDSILKECL